VNFSKRSYEKELLDREDIPFEDIRKNMEELDFINRRLGGHQITIAGLQIILNKFPEKRSFAICEIGCGGGDNLRVIKKYCEKKHVTAKLTGIDINPHCTSFAGSRKENAGIEFIASDYKLVKFDEKPDIIFSSLFCHHFTDEGVKDILSWMGKNSAAGFFINDLHRHPVAYYSIKLLSGLFSKSYLVKNDAPLSVLRGFKRKEWEMFNDQCSMPDVQLKWRWAFRWLLTYTHE
jgi:SAM-dependent methyltransferase